MEQKQKYRTKHGAELIAYLQSIPGRHFTVGDVGDYFKTQGTPMGTTTIYRQLERFVEDGTVRKYLLETGDSACYEYVPERDECAAHFHLKCEKCGKLIHMNCGELKNMQNHLLESHGFEWNIGKTVFYGICDECRK